MNNLTPLFPYIYHKLPTFICYSELLTADFLPITPKGVLLIQYIPCPPPSGNPFIKFRVGSINYPLFKANNSSSVIIPEIDASVMTQTTAEFEFSTGCR